MWFLIFLLFHIVLSDVTQETTTDYNDYNSTTVSADIYNSSDSSTESECNSSNCFNTTEKPTVSSSTTPVPKLEVNIQYDMNDTVCLCNLHRKICDINCCCDQDCTNDRKMIFDHCDSVENVNIDKRACNYIQYNYVNVTLREWDIQNNDLLCVVKRNVPPSYIIQKREPLNNYDEAILQKDTRYSWPEASVEVEQVINYSEPFVQGTPLRVILNNSTIDTFKINEAFISSGCNIQTEIRYLYDVSNACVQIVNERNDYLKVNYYSELLFIATPNMFNYTKLRNKLLTCSRPTCLNADLQICSEINLKKCRYPNGTDVSFKCSDNKEYITCQNVLKSLKYTFYHEGIKGIKNFNLSVYLVDLTFKSTEQYEIEQSISVEFQWEDAHTTIGYTLSGNPGYIIGKPVLTGNFVNNSVVRDPDTYSENFMVLPYEDMGVCEIGRDAYQPIEFGYNTILTCSIRGILPIAKNAKPNDVCKKIQLEIYKYWNILETKGSFINRTFGRFGNANASIHDDWGEILFEKTPKLIIDNISGKLANENKTLMCEGLVFELNIDVIHARVDLKKVVEQEKILAITHRFQSPSNISLTYNSKSSLSYEFDLDTKVLFCDVTSPKLRKLVDTPSLNIKLPSDFFYPFVKVGNGCCSNIIIFPMIFISCILLVCL